MKTQKKLQSIMDVFSSHDKRNTPVAIIQNGSLPNEKVGIGTVSTIANVVDKEGLSSPAIIVVGEIVKYTKQDQLSILMNDYVHTSIE